uniref:Uncharacterized protein n=1 Tax=Panagrolaimus davidi TaxID=227884 RepID=A0A914R5X3_9BILA
MLIEGVNSKKLDISSEEKNPAKKIRIEQPMESVEDKNLYMNDWVADDEIIDYEFSAFPQQQCSLPAQRFYYEEPHGCNSKSVPLTNSIPFPQQQQQQPHEQHYYNDLINPVGYQNDFSYQMPTNSQPGNNVDGSMIEKIVIQDSFGNF